MASLVNHDSYMKIIIHDILDARGLTSAQLNYVFGLDKTEKDEIIKLLNRMVQTCGEYILNCECFT
jgi:hypothetical protein